VSLPSCAAKRDAVEPDIIATLQRAGWYVCPLSGKGIPDLLAGPKGGPVLLIECKTGNAALTPDQVKWHKDHAGWPIHIVRTGAQASKLVRMVDEARRREIAAAVDAELAVKEALP
jgi:Holliday junction resolvase